MRPELMLQASTLAGRCLFDLRRHVQALRRRFGTTAVLAIPCLVIWIWALGVTSLRQQPQEPAWQNGETRRTSARAPAVSAPDRLLAIREFVDRLPVDEDAPGAVRDILDTAASNGLSIAHAEYRSEVDRAGLFTRYRMTFPATGDTEAIVRFMRASMRAHETLALESLTIKRDRSVATRAEARIQWSLLTRVAGGEHMHAGSSATLGGPRN